LNFKLTIQYDGTEFHGWQEQGDLRTVQSELTQALEVLEGRKVVVNGSGRTDAGVHAEGQVANVVVEREFTPDKLRAALNGNLASDLRVIDVQPVSHDFHARLSAREKTYIYRIVNGPVISPFWNRYACHEARPLNLDRMNQAGALFLGTHDWTAFSAAQSDAENRIRTITRLDVSFRIDARAPGPLIEINVAANGFLRYMVRSIAGTLLALGRGELDDKKIQEAIESGNRSLAGPTAPARGLALFSVSYD